MQYSQQFAWNLKTRWLPIFISLSIALPQFPTAAYADFSNENLDRDFTALNTESEKWAQEQEMQLPVLLSMAQKLQEKALRKIAADGEEELMRLVDVDNFDYEEPGVGKIEYRLIENKLVPRAVLYATDKSYLLVDENVVSKDSKHLRQYVARSHKQSGKGRVVFDSKGRKRVVSGRDLYLIFLKENVVNDVVYSPKPKITQWQWWKDAFYQTYKKPSFDSFSMALVTGGAFQGALTLIASSIRYFSNIHGIDFGPEYFNAVIPATAWASLFGTVIGTYYSTYKNFTQSPHSKWARMARSQMFSQIFGSVLVTLTHITPGGELKDQLSSLEFWTAAGFLIQASILMNGVANNFAKDYWNQMIIIREKVRNDLDPIKMKFLGLKNVEWSRANFKNQILYMAPWTLNLISLLMLGNSGLFDFKLADMLLPTANALGINEVQALANSDAKFSIPVLQFLGIPIAMWMSKRRARKMADALKDDPSSTLRAKELNELALRYESQWDRLFGKSILEYPRRILNKCEALLGGGTTETR